MGKGILTALRWNQNHSATRWHVCGIRVIQTEMKKGNHGSEPENIDGTCSIEKQVGGIGIPSERREERKRWGGGEEGRKEKGKKEERRGKKTWKTECGGRRLVLGA